MIQLFDHQKRIIAEDKKVTGLFLGTGAAKTLTALLLAKGKTLVICPKTQKEDGNWEREARKYVIKLDFDVVSKETFRSMMLAGGVKKYDTIIVDEAHTCLGVTPSIRYVKKQAVPKTSQLFEALELYVKTMKPSRVYLCTATIMRSPMTVWGAAKILGHDWNFYEFRSAFYVRLPMPGREVWTAKSDDETKERLALAVKKLGYVGRLEEFFDVPAQTHKVVYIELSAKQKARIKEMAIEYPDPLVRVGKIHQIENGVLAGDEFNASESFESAKLDSILDLAVEYSRMVVFVKYTAQIDDLATSLSEKGHKVLILDGRTKDRGAVILEANKSKECIFIAQAQVSSGWQLGKTKDHPEYYDYNCMIFASRTYSFVDLDQALGRIQRADNIKKNLYVYLVTKGGTDEAVHKALESKKDFNEKLYAEEI